MKRLQLECYHCGSSDTVLEGTSDGRRRYRCKDCGRHCISNPKGKYGKQLKRRGVFPEKSELILKLRALADRLGRSPTGKDVVEASKDGRFYTLKTYRLIFGSFNAALDAAMLERNMKKKMDKDGLLNELRFLSQKLKRGISCSDVVAAGKKGDISPRHYFYKAFENITKAIEEAGVELKEPSREEVVEMVRSYAKHLGRTPRKDDFEGITDVRFKEIPSVRKLRKMFGGLVQLRKAVGLEDNRSGAQITDEELIKHLQKVSKEIGKTPTAREIDELSQQGKGPSASTYLIRFGSYSKACEIAKLRIRRGPISDEELIKQVRNEWLRKDRVALKFRDLEESYKAGRTASPLTIQRRLGTMERINNIASGKLTGI